MERIITPTVASPILDMHRQPSVLTNEKAGYFFYGVYMSAVKKGYFNKSIDKWTGDEKAEIRDIYQQCLDRLETASTRALSRSKIMFTKEHAFWFANPATLLETASDSTLEPAARTNDFRLKFPSIYGHGQTFSPNNKTIFPDEYLRTWRFAFMIRHPALAWPSMHRAMYKLSKIGWFDEDGAMGVLVNNMTWKWTRQLYDWCMQNSDVLSAPLILDAHDVIHNPDVVFRFCELTGLDKDTVQFEWGDDTRAEKPTQGGQNGLWNVQNEAVHIMTSTLKESNGVIKGKTPAVVDIDAEVEKWKDEFGIETAAFLENAVRETMPDYEYLRERCLRV
ncbi:hypothetical protein OQA88_12493 [Cercophora sp. LCS_1]